MNSMARKKATITVDPEKLEQARHLTGAASSSATIDVALGVLIRRERLRRDVAAYAGRPPSAEETSLTGSFALWDDLADDTDWDALYEEQAR